MPIPIATGSPTEDQSEKRPPTQSANGNTLHAGKPQASAPAVLAVAASTCLGVASGPSDAASQRRAASALANVSCVVKVFEATTTRVEAGSSAAVASSSSAGSTLATKRTRGPS